MYVRRWTFIYSQSPLPLRRSRFNSQSPSTLVPLLQSQSLSPSLSRSLTYTVVVAFAIAAVAFESCEDERNVTILKLLLIKSASDYLEKDLG